MRLDTLLQVFPKLTSSITRRQFINAMSDKLPRDDWKKKSQYLSELQETIAGSATQFIQEILASRHTLPSKFIDVYVEDIPGDFHTFLRNNNFTTRFEENKIYVWDSNTSYSKTDGFVRRETQCVPVACLVDECFTQIFNQGVES